MGGRPMGGMFPQMRATYHNVQISKAFWVSECEVNQRQYEAVMQSNPSQFHGADLPVEQVTWHDAVAFCEKLTTAERRAGRLPTGYVFRLPTEAEWEYCCRAGTPGEHAGDVGKMAWHEANASGRTHRTGRMQANRWGLYDMHGNVSEWCLDWQVNYARGSARDPMGPESGTLRVIRGGSWLDDALYCGSGRRGRGDPAGASVLIGFRVVLARVLGRGSPTRK